MHLCFSNHPYLHVWSLSFKVFNWGFTMCLDRCFACRGLLPSSLTQGDNPVLSSLLLMCSQCRIQQSGHKCYWIEYKKTGRWDRSPCSWVVPACWWPHVPIVIFCEWYRILSELVPCLWVLIHEGLTTCFCFKQLSVQIYINDNTGYAEQDNGLFKILLSFDGFYFPVPILMSLISKRRTNMIDRYIL